MLDKRSISALPWGTSIELPSSRELRTSPHYVGGRYPCRSVAYVPRLILEDANKLDLPFTVLDPFMGSGTTAIEAGQVASAVYGVEVDEYARLVAAASTTPLNKDALDRIAQAIDDVLVSAPDVSADTSLAPSLTNIDYWFTDESFDDLLKLKTYIIGLRLDQDEQNLLLTAFGDIIRACSRAERQSLKPYISTKYEKVIKPVFPEFHKVAHRYLNAIRSLTVGEFKPIQWLGRDATNFETETKIDLAITSPPYINAMDYTRCIKLESAWIGTGDDKSLKETKRNQLGEASRRHQKVEPWVLELCTSDFGQLADRDPVRFQTSVAFFEDMRRNLTCVRDALQEDGTYYLIIGNSRIRDVEIETHRIVAEIATQIGFKWSRYFTYKIRDHRTSIPRGDRGGKIEVEHVIGLSLR